MRAIRIGALALCLAAGSAQADLAAKRVFGAAEAPSDGPVRIVGSYGRGCLFGAAALPEVSERFVTMRPSRNRHYGHPAVLAFVERLSAEAPSLGWNGLLVGDISQPLGGPMLYGHTSHQVGLDVDIWLQPMPHEPMSVDARETRPFVSVLDDDGRLNKTVFTPAAARLIEAAARDPEVERIFVTPQIKRALCERAAPDDRAWLRQVRPWYGHDKHFHVRLKCPAGERGCRPQRPTPPGDGCGAPLAYWFTAAPYTPKPGAQRRGPLPLSRMPAACRRLVATLRPPAPVPSARPAPERSAAQAGAEPDASAPTAQPATPTGQLTPVPPSPQ